jgi:hypothetical protein
MIHQAYVVHQRNMITARSAPEDNAAEAAANDTHVGEAPNPKKIFFWVAGLPLHHAYH